MTIVTVGIDLVTAGVMLDNPYVLIAVGEVANALTVCASGPSDLPGRTFRFGLEQAGVPHNAQRSTPFDVAEARQIILKAPSVAAMICRRLE